MRFRHPTAVALAAAVALALVSPLTGDEKDDGKWIQLFNGRDLSGWTPKFRGFEAGVNYNDTFRVEDGLLTVSYEKYEKFGNRFGHLFHKTPFEAPYRLRAEYRFIGEQVPGGPGWAWRNNGLMIHGQSPESMDKNQSFPNSIEVQLLGGKEKGERSTANLCTPGTHVVKDGKLYKPHIINSKSKTYRGDAWVTVEVEVHKDTIKHLCEGKVVLQYDKPQLDDGTRLVGGTISIQAESHPCQFRKIEVMTLEE